MKTAALLLLTIFAPTATFAVPLAPIDWYPNITNYALGDIGRESLIYDATTDRLTYVARGAVELSDYYTHTDPTVLAFDHVFAFSMGIDKHGHITDHGSMLWLGDFGSGLEVLASGSVRRLGFGFTGVYDDAIFNVFGDMQVLFGVDFLDSRVAHMGRSMILLHEEEFTNAHATPFYDSFQCPMQRAQPGCDYFSTSGLIGLKLPEPNQLAALFFGLALLVIVRRRRSVRR